MPETNELSAELFERRVENIQLVTGELLRLVGCKPIEIEAYTNMLMDVGQEVVQPEALVAACSLQRTYVASFSRRSRHVVEYELSEQIMMGMIFGAPPSEKPRSIVSALAGYSRLSPDSAELKAEGLRYLESGLHKLLSRTKNR